MSDRDIQNQPDRTVLPPPESPFKGKIETAMKNSTLGLAAAAARPRKVLPNRPHDHWRRHRLRHAERIRQPGEYAGFFDRIAKEGLRYTDFHTTAVCAASRAAFLTGRAMPLPWALASSRKGAAGFPGYNCMIPPSAASVLSKSCA